MSEVKMEDALMSFSVWVRKLVRSDLRLQLFRKHPMTSDISAFIDFEQDYFEKLKSQVLSFKGSIPEAENISKKIFLDETLRRIKMHERHMNFFCPDCLHLKEDKDIFTCSKGVDPAKVMKCDIFEREDTKSWSKHVNNQQDCLNILKEILDQKRYLFDFSLLQETPLELPKFILN